MSRDLACPSVRFPPDRTTSTSRTSAHLSVFSNPTVMSTRVIYLNSIYNTPSPMQCRNAHRQQSWPLGVGFLLPLGTEFRLPGLCGMACRKVCRAFSWLTINTEGPAYWGGVPPLGRRSWEVQASHWEGHREQVTTSHSSMASVSVPTSFWPHLYLMNDCDMDM